MAGTEWSPGMWQSWMRLSASAQCRERVYHDAVDVGLQQEEGAVRRRNMSQTPPPCYIAPLANRVCEAGALTARPPGNDRYVASAPSNPKLTRWVYHDDVSILNPDSAADEAECLECWSPVTVDLLHNFIIVAWLGSSFASFLSFLVHVSARAAENPRQSNGQFTLAPRYHYQ